MNAVRAAGRAGGRLRAAGGGVLLLAALVSPLAAQVAAGDSAWGAGDYHAARLAYESTLHDNPGDVHSLYRLAILASWDGKLDSSLALLRDAREIEPAEPEVRFYQARVLAWAGRFDEAIARFDSLLADVPTHHEAAMGRAQTLAWAGRNREATEAYGALIARDSSDADAWAGRAQLAAWRGDLAGALRLYATALERRPNHVPSLVGRAQVRQWQGQPELAQREVDRALALDPNDREARQVAAGIRALVRPRGDATVGWSRDSDKNTLWWQSVGTSLVVGPGLRAFGSAGLAEASDPFRCATRLSAEAGAGYSVGNWGLTAALGVRRLAPDFTADRSLGTWRVSGSYRFGPAVGAGAGYAHYAFDETALLMGRRLDADELSAEGDIELRPDLNLGGGGSVAWISDDNRRTAGVVAVTQRLKRFSVGVYGRGLSYARKGSGYFSPDRFLVGEARGAYTYAVRRWEGRLSGGLGAQQVTRAGKAQSEWHAEARLVRRWATINEVALTGGISTSAVSSTTGAFRYYTAALSLRLGL